MSGRTGRDLAFLTSTAGALLRLLAGHRSAGRPVYAEDPASAWRGQMTLDRA